MAGRLTDRVAIVTGGSSAIGRAIAIRFAQEGARAVVVADVSELPREGGRPTHELISATGTPSRFVAADVTDNDAVVRAVAAADEFGGVDVLVNNAGLLRAGKLVDMAEEDFDAVLAVNVKGTFLCSRAAVRSMMAGERPGVIINLSSMGALQGLSGLTAYSAAKGAVRSLTYSMARELGRHGIRVCALHPGVIDSSMTRVDVQAAAKGTVRAALGRIGTAEEIAAAAAFLASQEAAFITGSSLTIDGGELCIG